MENKIDIFGVSPEEFDKWLETADRETLTTVGKTVVLDKLSSKQVSQEDIRRANAFYKKLKHTCLLFNVWYFLAHDFPVLAIDIFQIYLIIGKIFEIGPFCNLTWGMIFLPSIIDIIMAFLFFPFEKSK